MQDTSMDQESDLSVESSMSAGLESAAAAARTVRLTFRRRWALWLHWTIIVLFAIGLAYPIWMVFVELSPGRIGPLLGQAAGVEAQVMEARRLYAFEAWVIFIGFSIYLALTVIVPRINGRAPAILYKEYTED